MSYIEQRAFCSHIAGQTIAEGHDALLSQLTHPK
jgi:hypothetical protein